MNEQLIQRIQELIRRLEEQRAKMTGGTQASQLYERAIRALTTELGRLGQEATLSGRQIANITNQVNRFYDSLERGERARVRLGGDRFRTSSFVNNFKEEAIRREQEELAKINSGVYVREGNEAAERKVQQQASRQAAKAKRESDRKAREELRAANNEQLAWEKAERIRVETERRTANEAVIQAKATERPPFIMGAEATKAGIEQQRRVNKEQIDLLRNYIKERQEVLREAARAQARRNIGDVLPGGQAAAQNLFSRAQRIDPAFTPETIRRVGVQPGGFSRVQYQIQTAEGIFKSATFVVDRFGNVLTDTQRRFRSFGDGIMRDIGEFTKWSLAVAVVLGPLQKLGELTSIMIQNEATLADVSIALGNAQRSTNEVFQAASEIAEATGESLNGVLEAYNLAYRAAGGIADETERFATANRLLTDSIILSKLSTLEEAEAIDILSAALKQTSGDLNGGQELLNKWVTVSKVANVDLTTLATGFSVVGDAAEAAGLGADELSAVIATIAETSNQTGREVANTARALVAGFQSDQGRKVLESFGISPEFEGEARGFLDIMQQIYQLRDTGAISDTQFSRLTLALGGGTRRQAAFATFIDNFGKIGAIEKTAAAASLTTGEAFNALGKQTETVQTAVTRLGNSFQELAQSLGEDGGMLDIFKTLINLLSGAVKGFSDVTAALGKAGPVLYSTLGAIALLRGNNRGARVSGFFSDMVRDATLDPNSYGPALGYRQGLLGQGVYRGLNSAGNFAVKALPYAAGIGAAALPAIENFSQGRNAEGWADLAGGAIGGAIGTVLGGPVGLAVGATIGASIAEAFAKNVQEYKPTIEGLFPEPELPTPAKEETPETREQDALDALFKAAGKATGMGDYGIAIAQGIYNATGRGFSREEAALTLLDRAKNAGAISPEEYENVISQLQQARADLELSRVAKAEEQALATEQAPVFTNLISKYSAELLQKLTAGEIGTAPYRRGRDQLQNLDLYATSLYGAFGGGFGGTQEDFFNIAGRISAYGAEDQLQQLTQFATDIRGYDAIIQDATMSDEDHNKAIEKRNQSIQAAISLFNQLNQTILSQANLLKNTDLSQYTPEQQALIIQEAQGITRKPYEMNIEAGTLAIEEMNAALELMPDILVDVGNTTQTVAQTTTEAINEAIKTLEEAGKIPELNQRIGFQTFDVTSGELAGVVNGPQYVTMAKQLEALGYKLDEQTEIAVTSDGVLNSYTKDWKIVQYLLQEILDTEQKQLDGMYNLPAGSSFYVPYNAALYGLKGEQPAIGGTEQTKAAVETAVETVAKKLPKTDPNAYWLDATKGPERFKRPQPVPAMPDGELMRKFREADSKYPVPNSSANALDQIASRLNLLFETSPSKMMSEKMGVPSMNMFDLLGNIFQNLSTKLNLNLNSTTTIQVDGRQMAQVVKQYLKNDLVRYSTAGSSRTVNMV
jgi:hypothetical protein